MVCNALLCGAFAGVGLAFRGDPNKLFGEGKPGTLLSVLMLALSAWASGKRALGTLPPRIRLGWGILGSALAIAALDDMFKVHERLDVLINGWLGLDPEGFATRLDDIIVLMYAAPAGVAGIWAWRRYLFETPLLLARFIVAGVLFGAMIVCDLTRAFESLEESCKVMSATFIFVAITGTPIGAHADAVGGSPGHAATEA